MQKSSRGQGSKQRLVPVVGPADGLTWPGRRLCCWQPRQWHGYSLLGDEAEGRELRRANDKGYHPGDEVRSEKTQETQSGPLAPDLKRQNGQNCMAGKGSCRIAA
jgi:hypothetical protein